MSSNTVTFNINIGGTAYSGIAQLNKALNSVNINAEKTESIFTKIGNASIRLQGMMSVCQTLVGKVAGAIGKVVDAGSENELQKMNMTTLFKGNAEAAEDMFARISEYGKVTVYDKAGLLEAQKTMMSFGIEGEKSFATLKQIGDIAMGDKQKMQSLALAFSQATSAGKLQGQDLLQLINAGFNPLQVISERTGESMSSLKEKMSKGQISAEMLSQAFQWATDEQGLFYQGAEKAGSTTMGRINQLKDTFDEFLISAFDALKPLIDTCLSFATGFLEYLPALLQTIGSAIGRVIDFFGTFAPVIIGAAAALGILTIACNTHRIALMAQDMWLNILIIKEKAVAIATKIWSGAQAILNAIMTANPIGLIIAGIAALIGLIVMLCTRITGWGSLWDGIVGFMKYSFYAFVDGVKLYFSTLVNGIMIGLDTLKLGWYKFKEACGIGDSAENQAAIAAINGDIEKRQQAIVDGAKKVAENAAKAKDSLAGIEMGWKGKEKTEKAQASTGMNSRLQESLGSRTSAQGGAQAAGTTSRATEAVATGGSRSTNITINLKDLVGQISFNGSLADKREEMERTLAESMFRVLAMAQSSVA